MFGFRRLAVSSSFGHLPTYLGPDFGKLAEGQAKERGREVSKKRLAANVEQSEHARKATPEAAHATALL